MSRKKTSTRQKNRAGHTVQIARKSGNQTDLSPLTALLAKIQSTQRSRPDHTIQKGQIGKDTLDRAKLSKRLLNVDRSCVGLSPVTT